MPLTHRDSHACSKHSRWSGLQRIVSDADGTDLSNDVADFLGIKG